MTLTIVKGELEDRIHRIADSLQDDIRDVFIRAATELKATTPLGRLTDLIDNPTTGASLFAGTIEMLEESFSSADIIGPIRDALQQATVRSAEFVAAEYGLSFDAINQRAVTYATAQSSLLFDQLAGTSFDAVQEILVQGQLGNAGGPRDQARQIRNILGLDDRAARAANRVYFGALESGMNRLDARRLAERTSARHLARRADNIARTETIRAANRGTELGWIEAADKGFLPPQAVKVWIATEDSRTCPICAVLDGNQVSIDGTFDTQERADSFTVEGGVIRVASTVPLKRSITTRTPPAHPRCRCTVGIELEGVETEFDPQDELNEKNRKRLAEKDADPRPGIDDNPQIRDAAREIYEENLRRESELTGILRGVQDDTNATFQHFGERVKYETSIRSKIRRNMDEGMTFTEAVADLKDGNRYTLMWDADDHFASSQQAAVKAMTDAGWEVPDGRDKNYWPVGREHDGGVYHGMNYTFRKGDDWVEVQFHTPTSALIKDDVHPIYSRWRDMPAGPDKDVLYREMQSLWRAHDPLDYVPPNMDGIGTQILPSSGPAPVRTVSILEGFRSPNDGYQPYANFVAVADELGVAPDDLLAGWQKAIDDSTVNIDIHWDNLESVLDDGRFKSQFEVGRSNGSFTPDTRSSVEDVLFGFDYDDVTQRPIYGWVGDSSDNNHVGMYGGTTVVMKDTVRASTTVTMHDSLGANLVPSVIDDLDYGAFDWTYPQSLIERTPGIVSDNPNFRQFTVFNPNDPPFSYYVEAQIHGGMATVDNIQEVIFRTNPVTSVRDKLDALGIPWSVREELGESPFNVSLP